ncbi:Protein of unknown function [Azotobacter beijerinckii]|uniref:DUF2971 domain-containing protein n=1 Tax=Azotobacter beijerinckii TaxID=170623 RepID=A0A1H7AEP2_9GAMM|nr:DUF2971 domain-containing protein [Azotobacter beijerinckii]SEJ64101.1 Protein of unknown function [Azotobacter beijerinckii]
MSTEEPKVFYRFRPISRLLGQPAVPEKRAEDGTYLEPAKPAIAGELEEGYIFFPSPESLNDPFEGYTKFYWSGDRIVWANLFRHYVHSLGCHHIARMLGAEQRPIPMALSRASNRFREVFEEACELVLTDERLQAHIQELAYGERKVTRGELFSQLVSMHQFITDRLFFVFAKHKFVPEFKPLWENSHSLLSDALLAAQQNSNKHSLAPEHIEAYFVRLGGLFKSASFTLAVAKKCLDSEKEVFVDFPTVYVDQLPTLTHSPWYVACFMSECTNSAIWGSYGDNHKGACLIFDTVPNDDRERCLMLTVASETTKGLETRPWRAKLQKVEYEDDPIELNFFESLFLLTRTELDINWLTDRKGSVSTATRGYRGSSTRDKYWNDLEKRLTRKWKDWAQETEYRIVYNPSLQDVSSPKHRKLKYEFSALKGICFGAKTSFDDILQIIEKIIALCEKHNRPEFEFYQAFHNSGTNALEIIKLATLAEIKEGEPLKNSVPPLG